MFQGELEVILTSAKPSEPMQRVESAKLERNAGIVGDRYSTIPGVDAGREVTLIEAEAVEAVQNEYNLSLTVDETRRNLVTRGVPLNHLVGREFTIGQVRLRGIRLCEPCKHLDKLTGKALLKALAHRGGLRATIVDAGTVHLNDSITPCSDVATTS